MSDLVTKKAVVIEKHPNARYEVEFDNGESIIAYTSGNMKRHNIDILPGDEVEVEMSVYDLTNGRIVYRNS